MVLATGAVELVFTYSNQEAASTGPGLWNTETAVFWDDGTYPTPPKVWSASASGKATLVADESSLLGATSRLAFLEPASRDRARVVGQRWQEPGNAAGERT